MLPLFRDVPVLIRGGGDLASGVAYRLRVAGFPVTIIELPEPLVIRRKAAYAAAVFEEAVTVGGLTARLLNGSVEAQPALESDEIAVIVDPEGDMLKKLAPVVLVDARMAKTNLGTTLHDAPLVIALGPGFTAGVDCHAVVETNRGHDLGRVIWQGSTEPDTKTPGRIAGRQAERVLRAPADGHVEAVAHIGDVLEEGDLIARVSGVEVRAPFPGVLRGLVHESVRVHAGLKIGDLDPRLHVEHCFTISDKALAVGGGVLEAILSSEVIRRRLAT